MSSQEIVITPRDKTVSGILFIVMILLFMIFVIAVALAEYREVAYARQVVSELPTYLVFALIIILIYLIAWAKTRGSSEKTGIWKYS
ncbi:MAG: hypothetical protein QXE77_01185 [Desulfurococcaceae archaeon]